MAVIAMLSHFCAHLDPLTLATTTITGSTRLHKEAAAAESEWASRDGEEKRTIWKVKIMVKIDPLDASPTDCFCQLSCTHLQNLFLFSSPLSSHLHARNWDCHGADKSHSRIILKRTFSRALSLL
jgi:hypothetical protein